MSLPEQADNKYRGRHRGYAKHLKRKASKTNRQSARAALRRGEQPENLSGRYNGWES